MADPNAATLSEEDLTRRVVDLATDADCSAVVVLVDPEDGARLRYAVDDGNALLNAGIAILCAAEARAIEHSGTCQGCVSKAAAIGEALKALGFPPGVRGQGAVPAQQRALH